MLILATSRLLLSSITLTEIQNEAEMMILLLVVADDKGLYATNALQMLDYKELAC